MIVKAVLFDRDGTLIDNVPYLRDPRSVRLRPDVEIAIAEARRAGLKIGAVSNQSGIERGYLALAEVEEVNSEIERLVGLFDTWQICPHGPTSDCSCRKPEPGLVLSAARSLGVKTSECVVIGDRGTDIEAAQRAGACAILVPSPDTNAEEIAAADIVICSISGAVRYLVAKALRKATGQGEAIELCEC